MSNISKLSDFNDLNLFNQTVADTIPIDMKQDIQMSLNGLTKTNESYQLDAEKILVKLKKNGFYSINDMKTRQNRGLVVPIYEDWEVDKDKFPQEGERYKDIVGKKDLEYNLISKFNLSKENVESLLGTLKMENVLQISEPLIDDIMKKAIQDQDETEWLILIRLLILTQKIFQRVKDLENFNDINAKNATVLNASVEELVEKTKNSEIEKGRQTRAINNQIIQNISELNSKIENRINGKVRMEEEIDKEELLEKAKSKVKNDPDYIKKKKDINNLLERTKLLEEEVEKGNNNEAIVLIKNELGLIWNKINTIISTNKINKDLLENKFTLSKEEIDQRIKNLSENEEKNIKDIKDKEERDVKSLKEELDNRKKEITKLEGDVQKLKNELEDYTKKTDQKIEDLLKLTDYDKIKEKIMKDVKTEIQKKEKEINKTIEEKTQKAEEDNKEELKKVQLEVNKAKGDNSKLAKETKELDEKFLGLLERVRSGAEDDFKQLKKDVNDGNTIESIKKLKESMEDLQKLIKKNTDDLSNLTNNFNNSQKETAQLKKELNEGEKIKSIESMGSEIKKLEETTNLLNIKEINEMIKEYKTTKTNVDSMQKDINEQKKGKETLEDLVKSLNSKIGLLEGDNKAINLQLEITKTLPTQEKVNQLIQETLKGDINKNYNKPLSEENIKKIKNNTDKIKEIEEKLKTIEDILPTDEEGNPIQIDTAIKEEIELIKEDLSKKEDKKVPTEISESTGKKKRGRKKKKDIDKEEEKEEKKDSEDDIRSRLCKVEEAIGENGLYDAKKGEAVDRISVIKSDIKKLYEKVFPDEPITYVDEEELQKEIKTMNSKIDFELEKVRASIKEIKTPKGGKTDKKLISKDEKENDPKILSKINEEIEEMKTTIDDQKNKLESLEEKINEEIKQRDDDKNKTGKQVNELIKHQKGFIEELENEKKRRIKEEETIKIMNNEIKEKISEIVDKKAEPGEKLKEIKEKLEQHEKKEQHSELEKNLEKLWKEKFGDFQISFNNQNLDQDLWENLPKEDKDLFAKERIRVKKKFFNEAKQRGNLEEAQKLWDYYKYKNRPNRPNRPNQKRNNKDYGKKRQSYNKSRRNRNYGKRWHNNRRYRKGRPYYRQDEDVDYYNKRGPRGFRNRRNFHKARGDGPRA